MNSIKSKLPFIALTGVFFIGNAVINLPFARYPESAVSGFILSVIISIPFIILCSFVLNSIGGLTLAQVFLKKGKIKGGFFIILFTLYALFCGLVCIRNFITFSDKVILPEIGSFFPSILFLLLLLLLCREDKHVILKTALVSSVIIAVSTLMLFLLSIDSMNFSNIIKISFTDIKGILYEALSYLAMSFLEGVILIGFFSGQIIRGSKNTLLSGLIFAVIILSLCFTQSIAVFGSRLTGELLHPYASAVSIISFGDKFSRMEGFSYFLYFASTLIKTAVCVTAGKESFLTLFPKAKPYFLISIGLIYSVFCIFVNYFENAPFIQVAPFLTVPAIVVLAGTRN